MPETRPEAGVHVGRWIDDSARRSPDRVAVITAGDGPVAEVSYASLAALVDRATGGLLQRGIGAGDRVFVLAHNRLETIALFFACARLGAVLVPGNRRLAAPELAGIVADADPAVIFLGPGARDLWRGVLAASTVSAPAVELATATDASASSFVADLPHEGDTPLLLLFTSGTTGRPKGAVLTHRTITWNALNTEVGWDLSGRDATLCHTPLFHTGGWNVLTLPLLRRGGAVVLTAGFDPAFAGRGVAERGVTALFAVPTMWRLMLEAADASVDLGGLAFAITGGAACPVPLIEAWAARGVVLRQGYGLTEVGPNCFFMPAHEALTHAGTVGFPMPHLEVRLVDGGGETVRGPGEGELLLRGPTVCAGYRGRPEATQNARRPGGWFATGDLFRRDADGRFAFVGRKKEMFVSGGENVYPAEVERALYDLPEVAEAAVVPVPHELWGEVGHAFVAPPAGVGADGVDGERILASCRSVLARYKVPKYITVLDALPKGPSGKIAKTALRAPAGGAA